VKRFGCFYVQYTEQIAFGKTNGNWVKLYTFMLMNNCSSLHIYIKVCGLTFNLKKTVNVSGFHISTKAF